GFPEERLSLTLYRHGRGVAIEHQLCRRAASGWTRSRSVGLGSAASGARGWLGRPSHDRLADTRRSRQTFRTTFTHVGRDSRGGPRPTDLGTRAVEVGAPPWRLGLGLDGRRLPPEEH